MDNEQELQRMFEKFQSGVKLTDDEMQKLAKDASLANRALSNMGSALGSLTKHALSLSKKLYEGEQGASVFNDTIKSGTDTFGDFLLKGNLVAKFFGVLVKAIGGYVSEVNKMSDNLYKSYQNLSKTGVAASDGMMGLAAASQQLGFGLEQIGLDAFARVMTNASKDLAMLSGSAIEGRKNFVDFSSSIVRGDTGRQLMNMGMSIESINEGVASYVKQQVQLGRAQNMTNQQLRDGAVAYLKEMDALTKLTGIQKAELEAQMENNRRNERFRAAIEKVRREQGDDAARNLELNMAAASERFPELSEGLKDLAAGYVNTEAAAKALRAGMADVPQAMTRGLGSGFNELNQAAKNTTESMGSLAEVGGYGDAFGNFYESLKAAGMTQQDFEKRVKEIQADRLKQEEGLGDKATADQTNLRRTQLESKDALQNLVKAGINPVTAAMTGLAKVTNTVVTGLGGKVAGGYSGGGGGGAAAGGGGGGGGGGGAAAGGGGGGGAPTGGGLAQVKDAAGGGGVGFFRALGMGMQGLGLGATGPTSEPVSGVEGKLLNFIGKIEGRGDYNILVGGKSLPELTEMTVGQVLDYQSGMRSRGHESTAVGKYQIIQGTLQGLLKRGVVSPDDKFNASTQDKLATALMQGRGLDQYKAGKIPADAFADSLAKEWASLPTASGRSYYAGTGSNKSLVGRDEFMSVFARDGGVFAGPKSGYAATLHGTEAVIPLPDGKTIPVVMPELASNLKDQMGVMGAQLMALENLVSIMRDQTSISTKILQAANN